MKPIVLQPNDKLIAKVINTYSGSVEVVVNYAESGNNLFEEKNERVMIYNDGNNSEVDQVILDNTGTNKLVIVDVNLYNNTTDEVNIELEIDDGLTNIFILGRTNCKKDQTINLDSFINYNISDGGGGGGGESSGLSIAPVAKYDGSLVKGVFEEIQLPSNITINSIKAVLEGAPIGSDDTHDDTKLAIEYTTDGGANWTIIALINFDADDTRTNGVLIKDVSVGNNYTENTRIRFNIVITADDYAGDNLKVYFK